MTDAHADTIAAPAPRPLKPPPEVVLPTLYYLLLLAEAGALVGVHYARPEESGAETVSYALGWAGTVSMIIMHVYSLRRRLRALRGWGKIRYWLHFHIFCGLQGAMLVTYHSLHLHDPRSVQGLNILCVGIVVLSGIIGRYLYAFLPKSIAGDRLSATQIEDELSTVTAQIAAEAPSPELAHAVAGYAGKGQRLSGPISLGQLVAEDLRARRALRQLKAALASARAGSGESTRLTDFARLAQRRVLLSRRLATFAAGERLFRGWTIFHKPLTFLLLGATLLHVIGHYMYSAGMSG